MCGTVVTAQVWLSKILSYEKPYCVKGTNKPAGSYQAPKRVYEKIGLSERGKALGSFENRRTKKISRQTNAEKRRSNQ